jgi:hypothetical protein
LKTRESLNEEKTRIIGLYERLEGERQRIEELRRKVEDDRARF